jgi:hypothetical protein
MFTCKCVAFQALAITTGLQVPVTWWVRVRGGSRGGKSKLWHWAARTLNHTSGRLEGSVEIIRYYLNDDSSAQFRKVLVVDTDAWQSNFIIWSVACGIPETPSATSMNQGAKCTIHPGTRSEKWVNRKGTGLHPHRAGWCRFDLHQMTEYIFPTPRLVCLCTKSCFRSGCVSKWDHFKVK